MRDETTRITRLQAQDSFVNELGLEPLSGLRDGETTIQRFNWPRANSGARHDRTVTIFTWPDGSWSESVDAGRLSISETVVELRRMVARN